MKIILVRHGKDPKGYCGGWNKFGLTKDGAEETKKEIEQLKDYDFKYIISSDLNRAIETANIIGDRYNKNIVLEPRLREINNGDLAGMPNELANQKYPGLYYNTLEKDQKYPNGESPNDFFLRIKRAFDILVKNHEDVLVVTHSGVINILYCIANNIEFSNKKQKISIAHAKHIVIEV